MKEEVEAIKRLKEEKTEEIAKEFLQYFARINGIDINSITEKNGALIRNGYKL